MPSTGAINSGVPRPPRQRASRSSALQPSKLSDAEAESTFGPWPTSPPSTRSSLHCGVCMIGWAVCGTSMPEFCQLPRLWLHETLCTPTRPPSPDSNISVTSSSSARGRNATLVCRRASGRSSCRSMIGSCCGDFFSSQAIYTRTRKTCLQGGRKRSPKRIRAAQRHEQALMLDLLILDPMRRLNLAQIDYKDDLIRNERGELSAFGSLETVSKTELPSTRRSHWPSRNGSAHTSPSIDRTFAVRSRAGCSPHHRVSHGRLTTFRRHLAALSGRLSACRFLRT